MTPSALASGTGCAVCGRPLVYGTEAMLQTCSLCGAQVEVLIRCPEGHVVCDRCHSKGALQALADLLAADSSANPSALLERVLAHPAVPMHGPEHHAIVPAVLVAAAGGAGYLVPEDGVKKAMERGRKVPGGWCGSYGACGAAIGVGIAVSVLAGATPVTGRERSLALAATAFALERMLDNGPRCCKRASRTALSAGVDFFRERLGLTLVTPAPVVCEYTPRNAQCVGAACVWSATHMEIEQVEARSRD